jgi:peptidoglycan endopeptidase LytE
VNIVLSQKDFFEDNRRIIKNKVLILKSNIRYLALDDVLEILEYDIRRRNTLNLVATDGSEFVTIPLKGGISRREGVSYRIDPLISDQGKLYLSFRSINRMFNVDLSTNLTKKQVFIKQPGQFFIAFRGDTLRSISMILNTTVKRLLALNKNLEEPHRNRHTNKDTYNQLRS